MTQKSQPVEARELLQRIGAFLTQRFSLVADRAADPEIDTRIQSGVELQGTNLWLLVLAMLIASIGLNVNSTAVVIGAMLISPLMGPIMGIGYGAGIMDFVLIRKSLKNIGIAAALAVLASTAYFWLSPLRTAQSELLARTTPTIWDVMIAFVGGLAGIIGVTRRQMSNVIPGVAIATALMPPLCTAGFGLATGNWRYFFGAFYLFAINCVFIAMAAMVVTRAFRVERRHFDESVERRVSLYMAITVLMTLLPSLWLAYRLVNEEIFKTRANQFVRQQLELARTHVANVDVNPDTRRIEVTLVGEVVPKSILNDVAARLTQAGLDRARLQVYQSDDQRIDMAALKSTLLSDLYRESQAALTDKERQLQQVQVELDAIKSRSGRFNAVAKELHVLYPQISNITLAEGVDWTESNPNSESSALVMNVRAARTLPDVDRQRIEQWLKTRLQTDQIRLVMEQ
jgi:uncharacterized hydrophobic protein (TIGR00271 family)